MSEQKQKFSASYAKDAVYRTGLREFMEYRDLGICAISARRRPAWPNSIDRRVKLHKMKQFIS
jgi:hypothetical protein